MRFRATTCLSALALLAGTGCAGSGRSHDATGAAPLDSVHIRSGDTLPPANPAARGTPRDSSTSDSIRTDSTRRNQTPT